MPTSRNLDVLARNRQRVRMEICYCSLYEECWSVSTRAGSRMAVASCALPKLGQQTWAGNSRQE
jgi:hypothetical protein